MIIPDLLLLRSLILVIHKGLDSCENFAYTGQIFILHLKSRPYKWSMQKFSTEATHENENRRDTSDRAIEGNKIRVLMSNTANTSAEVLVEDNYRGIVGDFSNFIKEMEEKTGIDFSVFKFKHLLLFFSYYKQISDENMRGQLFNIFCKFDIDFLKLFIAGFEICEFDPNKGELLVQLVEKRGEKAREILEHYDNICDLVELEDKDLPEIKKSESKKVTDKQFEDKAKIVETHTRHYIAAKDTVARMIADAMSMKNDEEFSSFLNRTQKYFDTNVLGGAFLSYLLDAAITHDLEAEEISKYSDTDKVVIMRGGNRIKSNDRNAMLENGNYLTDEFNLEDYNMVVKNLRKTYSGKDSGWMEHLINNIPVDLQNPDVHFVMVKTNYEPFNEESQNSVFVDGTVGIIKFKPSPKNQNKRFYVGTMYVEPILQQYRIADFLFSSVEKIIEKDFSAGNDYIYWGAVSVFNPSMQRHIEAGGGVATNIIKEGSAAFRSRDLYQVEFHHANRFWSKNKALSKDIIQKFLSLGIGSIPENATFGETIFEMVDTSEGAIPEFMTKLKHYFEKGYLMTRYFYEFKGNTPNPERTFIALEKPKTPILPVNPDPSE